MDQNSPVHTESTGGAGGALPAVRAGDAAPRRSRGLDRGGGRAADRAGARAALCCVAPAVPPPGAVHQETGGREPDAVLRARRAGEVRAEGRH